MKRGEVWPIIRDKKRYLDHFAAVRKFNEWEKSHPLNMNAQDALTSIGALYDLMPSESKKRPVDVSGLRMMRKALSCLKVDV